MPRLIVLMSLLILPISCGTDESAPSASNASTGTEVVDLWTPAALGDLDLIAARIAAGGDVNAADPTFSVIPLALAADFGQVDAVKALLEAGADPNGRNGNGSTPALGAAFFGRADCLALLLASGADPNLADENGTTTYTAVDVSWEITKAIADAMEMPLDRDLLERGRTQCRLILTSP